MTLFIRTDTAGTGAEGSVFPAEAFFHLGVIANGDTELGFVDLPPSLQQVTYARTDPGVPATRLDELVNTDFGVNPEGIDIVVIAAGADFVFNDGQSILAVGGRAIPPNDDLNPTTSCLAIYDNSLNNGQGYCVARDGTGGTLDLPSSRAVILYHELSHALRIVTDSSLPLTFACDPASPEENAAIIDENALRDQLGEPHRDPNIHCGAICGGGGGGGGGGDCCVVASVASGSPFSAEVAALRRMRDGLLRRSEVGFEFFRDLHEGYYGFSPEVCRMMAREPALQGWILALYVRPLVLVLRLLERYTLGGLRGARLTAFFEEDLGRAPDVAALGETELALAAGILRSPGEGLGEALSEVLSGWSAAGAEGPSTPGVYAELALLLRDAATPDEHVRWGLVEPIGIYLAALLERRHGVDAETLAAALEPAFDDWASRLPIAGGWVSLSRDELREELGFLSRALLVSDVSRRAFGRRLAERFPEERRLIETLAETGHLRGEG